MTQVNSINNDEGFSGVGTPWFRPHGQTTKYYWGNPIELKYKIEYETKIRESQRAEDQGEALSTKNKKKATTGTFATDTFVPIAWAFMLLGDEIKKTIPSETVTDESVKAVIHGSFDLPHEDIDASTFELKDKTSGNVIPPEQYELNLSMGLVQVTEASGIAAGTELLANYVTEAVSYVEVDPAAVSRFEGEFGFDGRNTAENDRKCKIYAPNLSVVINSEIDWVSEEFVDLKADLTFVKGKKGEKPVTIRYYD